MSDAKKGLGIFHKSKQRIDPVAPGPVMPGTPKNVRQRWTFVGIGVVAVVMISSGLLGKKPPERAQRAPVDSTVSVTPPNADKAAFESRYAKDLESVKSQVETLVRENDRKNEEIARLRKLAEESRNLPAGIVPPPTAPGAPQGNTGGIGFTVPPAPPTPIGSRNVPPVPVPPSSSVTPPAVPPLPGADVPPMGIKPAAPIRFTAPSVSAADADANGPAKVKAKSNFKKNDNFGLLPAGAFASMALLNGLDAGTSAATQTSPMPILMNITDHAVLPGASKYRLKSCFVLATAYGDLSAERVYARVSRVSCMDKNDRLVLSQEVQGYVVDSDGKLGLRGRITDRQGARLAKGLLAGFAQGMAGAFGQAQGVVSSNITTGTVTSSISGSAALRASGLSGAQSAANQLAEFYLREAQSIFPVITVDAGRTGTIVFTASAALNWATLESQYVQQVTPQN